MSGMMNKIADALTGHHHNTTTNNTTGLHNNNLNNNTALNNNAALPAGNVAGGVGTGYQGTNYSATNNGALKEGAQVRDTGLAGTRSHTAAYDSYNKDPASRTGSNLTGTGAGLATGAALGSQQSSTMNTGMNSGMYGNNTDSSLNTASTSQSTLRREEQNLRRDEQALLGREQQGDVAMTRHEEHLLVGKEKVNVGSAQLNKYVTTEKVSTAVPIIRERAVVEREPITDLNRDSITGPDFKEAHYEVNLMEERAVAEKEAVPIERVRLRKEVEQTQQYVEAELRKEHIEIVDPTRNAALGGKSLDSTATTGSQLGRNAAIDSSSRNL